MEVAEIGKPLLYSYPPGLVILLAAGALWAGVSVPKNARTAIVNGHGGGAAEPVFNPPDRPASVGG